MRRAGSALNSHMENGGGNALIQKSFLGCLLCSKPWESKCDYNGRSSWSFLLLGKGLVAVVQAVLGTEEAVDPTLRMMWVHVVRGFLYSHKEQLSSFGLDPEETNSWMV